MSVKLAGQHVFSAPRETVWRALNDIEVLSRTLPGCESLKQTAENQFAGVMQLKVGPVQGQFSGQVTLSNLVPPESYDLHLKGNGAPGFVEGSGTLKLTAQDDGRTLCEYTVETQVGGRIAGVGQRLLESSAKVITKQALEQLDRQLAAIMAAQIPAPVATGPAPAEPAVAPEPLAAATGSSSPPSTVEPATTPPGASVALASEPPPSSAAVLAPAPTQAEMARDFAKGMAAELVPSRLRPWLIAGGIVLLIALILLLRTC